MSRRTSPQQRRHRIPPNAPVYLRNLNCADISRKSGLSRQAVWRVLVERSRWPRPETMEALAKALRVSVPTLSGYLGQQRSA